METVFEQAKKVMQKNFCFTNMQEQELKAEGREIMNREDIKFIISLDLEPLKLSHIGNAKKRKTFSNRELGKIFKKAKDEDLGVEFLNVEFSIRNEKYLKNKKVFRDISYYGSTWVDFIFFEEEYFIKHEILKFKDLFSVLVSARKTNII